VVQLRHLVRLQEDLGPSYCKLAVVSVDSPVVNAALRAGLGASFPFLSDQNFKAIEKRQAPDDEPKPKATKETAASNTPRRKKRAARKPGGYVKNW